MKLPLLLTLLLGGCGGKPQKSLTEMVPQAKIGPNGEVVIPYNYFEGAITFSLPFTCKVGQMMIVSDNKVFQCVKSGEVWGESPPSAPRPIPPELRSR